MSFLKLRGEGYQARAMRGSMLTVINFGGHNILRLASNLILTRILFPEAFGLMALVQVVLAGTAMFSDLGIRGSIVQNARGDDPAFLNTAWTLQIGRGLVLGLAVLIMAGPLGRFYDEPQLTELLYFAAIVPAIQGFNSTRMASAGRHISLGRLTLLKLSSQAFGIVVMVILAWLLGSVWALLIGSAAGALALTCLSHIALPGAFNNKLAFEKSAAIELLSFGKHVFLATLASFFIQHGDRAVLGKYISLEELAIYNIGYFLAMVPLKFSRRLNDLVIFPLYSRRPPSESREYRSKINKARFFLTAFLISGTVVLALVGDYMVRLLYDPRYEGGGPVLVLIAVAALPQLITLSYERLPLSAGKSGRYAFFMILRAVLIFALTIFGVTQFGLFGAIVAPLLAWVLIYPVLVWVILPFKGWDPLHDAVFAALTLAAMAGVLFYQWQTVLALLPSS